MSRLIVLIAALAVLAGCALFRPPLAQGQTEAEVLAMLGKPTARHAMPQGITRLEYASGPWGYETWMVDLDGSGKVVAFDQVRNEPALYQLQPTVPGMTSDDLLRALGTPSERRPGGRAGGQVWSWRFPNTECRWFQVSLSDDLRAQSANFAIEQACDTRSHTPSADHPG